MGPKLTEVNGNNIDNIIAKSEIIRHGQSERYPHLPGRCEGARFVAAARQLSMTAPTVTRAVSALEERLACSFSCEPPGMCP